MFDNNWLDPRVTPGQPRTNSSHLALVARDAPMPKFEPGSAFTYDNLAYDVAAMAIERSTGLPCAQVIAERFSRPLGLAAFLRPARFADWNRAAHARLQFRAGASASGRVRTAGLGTVDHG